MLVDDQLSAVLTVEHTRATRTPGRGIVRLGVVARDQDRQLAPAGHDLLLVAD